jgi:hypothetical protein
MTSRDVRQVLVELQTAIENDLEFFTTENFNRLSIVEHNKLFYLDLYYDGLSDCYQCFLNTLINQKVADQIGALILRGADEGANGVQNWDITNIVESNVVFPNLTGLYFPLNSSERHNRVVIGRDYFENGVLARLLEKTPAIREFRVPSAPNHDFFQVGSRPLLHLSIDAGFDTQNFIRNFSNSACFPVLNCLEWGEYNETYMDDFQSRCTAFVDYELLFCSKAFESVKRFVWKNPVVSAEQLRQLKALRPELQLLVLRDSAQYI